MYSEEDIKLIKKANKRIKAIRNKFGDDSWASKKLKSRLNNQSSLLKSGFISTKKNLSDIEEKATLKAVQKFLDSKTSTLRGIRATENKIKSNISEYTSEYNPTKEDIQNLYEYFEDRDFRDLSKYIPPSDLHVLIMETQKSGLSGKDKKQYFVEQIKTYADFGNDFDINRTINRLYNKIK